ncbi:MAG: hypothetical protein GY851_07215 [bacterium]|nr:hypothetical protein [bacterium]
MANFTTESQVRMKLQFLDTEIVPADLVAASIDDAHTEILRHLDADVDTGLPEPGMVMGETLLAGAHVFRSLASSDAVAKRRIAIGGQQMEDGTRAETLQALAAKTEAQAWYLLEPCLAAGPPRRVCAATATVPVLGEE